MKPIGLSVSFLILGTAVAAHTGTAGGAWIRVNQLGYLPPATKVAVLCCADATPPPSSFEIVDRLTGGVVFSSGSIASCGSYGPFRSSYRLDFSGFEAVGVFRIRVDTLSSPWFAISPRIYDGTADFLLRYMRQQRSGFNPFLRDSCHTRDGYLIYGPAGDSSFVDVSGGWHDASDYLQYVTTSANATNQLLFAFEQFPQSFRDAYRADGLPGSNGVPDVVDEASWGLTWLEKMNPAPGVMYNQIADDRDHRGFRLPTEDTVSYGRGKERPVYYCTGEPQGLFQHKNRTTGIASTAAKFSSAFGFGARALRRYSPTRAESLLKKSAEAYAFAREHPGVCQTAPCRAPYFYEEDNWVDDMELAAGILSGESQERGFLSEAASFADLEPVTPWMGAETARHYQWYPFVNLGHPLLAAESDSALRERVLGYMRQGLERIAARGRGNPFLFGVPFIWCSNNLVVAALTQARLYRELSGDTAYAAMEAALRDWLFGCNLWGTSMIVGLPAHGVYPKDPHSAFSHVHGFRIDGGLVDGPVYGSIFKNLIGITLTRPDAFAPFQSDVAVYHDDWGDYSTNEPTMDGTASLTYTLASLEADGRVWAEPPGATFSHGAVVRMDSTRKVVYLAFTGHEYGEGGETIRRVLRNNGVKASFFLTGDFYRNPRTKGLVAGLLADGHTMGPHSDRHLLYADWERRDSLLVTRAEFEQDIRDNYSAMSAFGIDPHQSRVFMPPYEWYNDSVSVWCRELGLTLVNFTPGTRSNADYTTPDMNDRYVSSDTIVESVLRAAGRKPSGLNGHILLVHIGTDPRRTDKLYDRLESLIRSLEGMGYSFESLGSALGGGISILN